MAIFLILPSDMKRKIAGKEVFAIGLGAMPLSLKTRPPEKNAIGVIHKAIDLGVNFIDTADVYCMDDEDIGHNERLIAKALKEKNTLSSVFVATKGGLRRPGGAWTTDARPSHLREACENSLKALRVESLFLYQLHAPDDNVPFADSVGALAKLKEQGKIQNIGISNVSLDELNEAQKIVQIESVQNRCNPFSKRDFENGLIMACKEQNVTYLPHSPVGGHMGHQSLMQHHSLKEMAKKYHANPYQLVLAWFLKKGDHILPIPGASKISSIQSSVEATNIQLSKEDVQLIDDLC